MLLDVGDIFRMPIYIEPTFFGSTVRLFANSAIQKATQTSTGQCSPTMRRAHLPNAYPCTASDSFSLSSRGTSGGMPEEGAKFPSRSPGTAIGSCCLLSAFH